MSPQEQHLDDVESAALIRGRRILLVEDQLLVALETSTMIERFGAVVVGPYARVPAASVALRSQPVDAAILDINVAGVQTFAIADELQQRGVPFVFCTGYGRDILPPRFTDAPLVEKPVVSAALIAALLGVLKPGTA
jgi:CheY-like chemotaxis protein